MPLEKDQEARSGSRLHQKRSTSIYYYPFFSVVISFVFTSTRAMYAYLYTPEDDWPVFNGVEKGTYVYGEKLHEARHTTRAAKFLQCLIWFHVKSSFILFHCHSFRCNQEIIEIWGNYLKSIMAWAKRSAQCLASRKSSEQKKLTTICGYSWSMWIDFCPCLCQAEVVEIVAMCKVAGIVNSKKWKLWTGGAETKRHMCFGNYSYNFLIHAFAKTHRICVKQSCSRGESFDGCDVHA